MEFTFNIPVKTIFGNNCISKNSEAFKPYGTKALIITGKRSAKANGSYSDITDALDREKIKHHLFDRIEANPSVETVREAAAEAREQNANFIIGIGGGSPLDAAKAIAILAVNSIDDEQLFSGNYKNKPLPVIAIPTTAGTGSEVTPYSILTYNKIKNKKSIASESIFPVLAFLDPRYTETLSYTTTVNTAIDALSHSVEGYLSKRATDVIEPFALESIKILGRELKLLVKEKNPGPETRENLLYASMLAGIVIAHTGTTIVHSMGYPLTYYRDIDHGRANGLLMYEFLKFVSNSSKKTDRILESMGMDLEEFGGTISSLLGTKETLSEEELKIFTDTAKSAEKNVLNTTPSPSADDIKNIYIKSFT
jgi:alcohol dehydrogenase class IV